MKKFLKIFFIIFLTFFLIFISLLIFISVFFPSEKVKDIIVSTLSEKTGREVSIEKIDFNILKGLELKNFSIKENPKYKKEYFIKDEKVILKYNLFALLTGNLVISQFELLKPYIQVKKEKDGSFNFSDILEKLLTKEKVEIESEKKKEQVKTKKDKQFIKNIIITSISIKNGNFIFLDLSKEKKQSLKIENLNLNIQNIILSSIKPIEITLNFDFFYNDYKIPVNLKSEITSDFKNEIFDIKINSFILNGIITKGDIKIKNLKNIEIKGEINSFSNTKKMLEVLPIDLKKKIEESNISIDIINNLKFLYKEKKLNFHNELKLEKGEFVYQNKKFVENLNGILKITSNYDLNGNLDFLLAGQKVNLKISGENLIKPEKSVYTIEIYSPKFAVEYLLGLFPKKEKTKEKKVLSEKEKKEIEKKTKKEIAKMKSIKAPGIYINLKADSIFYKTINIGKTIANIRYVNNKLFSEFSSTAYQGKINCNLVADINKENYETYVYINKVIINQFVDDAISILLENNREKKSILSDLKGKVYGNFNLNAKFSGESFIDIPHTIKGNGDFFIKDGKLTSLTTARELAEKTGLDFLKDDIDFDIMAADFKMVNGKIDTKNFRIYKGENGKDGNLKIKGHGFVTVDDEIDFEIFADFNPRIAKKVEEALSSTFNIKDASYAYNEDGWMPFDFRIYGKGKNKKYDLIQKRMLENIKRNLTKKIEEQTKKFIEEKKPEIEKKAKEIFENLFKR